MISFGNESFNKFLGGGLLNSSLNLFERQGPSSRILDTVWNMSLAAQTLSTQGNLIYVNFNTSKELRDRELLFHLPMPRKVKADVLYKDLRGKEAVKTIKIAWRYSGRSLSPSDGYLFDQIDFGAHLRTEPDELGLFKIINVAKDHSIGQLINDLDQCLSELSKHDEAVNIIISDILHPFSPIIDDTSNLLQHLYSLRCLSRTIQKGAILISYDTDMFLDHANVKQHVYNIVDSVVSFYSYETGENKITGYKNTDGTVDYVKVPKINTFGHHFQRELSDWGYRFTRNHKFLVIDELNLPPCLDDEEDSGNILKKDAVELTQTQHKPLEQVGPLEDFRHVAKDILSKRKL